MDEWRKAYINYRGLKKLIKQVDAHYRARLAQASQATSVPPADNGRSQAARLLRRGNSARPATNSETLPHYGSTTDPAAPGLPPVSLDGTGLALPTEHAEHADDLEANASTSADPAPAAAPKTSMPGAEPRLSDEPMSYSDPDSASPPVRPSWVVPSRSDNDGVSLEQIIATQFDDQERLFFDALDGEVQRIVRFYEARENEALERMSTLITQLDELAEHRRRFKAKTVVTEEQQGGFSRILSVVPRTLAAEELKRARLRVQELSKSPTSPHTADEGDKRRLEAIEHMQALNIGPIHPDAPTAPAQHPEYDPIQYRTARKKLRSAVIENFRALEILNNYRILNRTGFTKILKKFDKTLDVQVMHPYYDTRVLTTPLVMSEAIPKLLHATEEIFTSYFEHGDRKRARDVLRDRISLPPGMREHNHHQSVFRTGLYLGVALCATIEGLLGAMDPAKQAVFPAWRQLLQVYGVAFIPVLFALLFGLNLAGWQLVRINTVFIFEWDAGNCLEPTQYFELPALLLLLLSIFFWVSFAQPTATSIAPTAWPMVWLALVVVIMVNPLPIWHRSSRQWFLRSLVRVMGGGLFDSVEFRDFFLGDELNSLVYSISNLWYVGCEYDHHFATPEHCFSTHSYWTPVLVSVPPFLRLLQCLRRYHDSKRMVRIHLVNAGKYASSILSAFFYFHYRARNSPHGSPFVLWILFAVINSLFTSGWDLIMDWNLLQRHSKYPLLRSNLAFEEVWPMYYVAMVTNVAIRFIWVIYLVGGPASLQLRGFLVALLEMLRRWQWNFIRLENEHLGNADSFKIVRDLPLPYPIARKQMVDDDDDARSTFTLRTLTMRPSEESTRENDERAQETLQRTRAGLQAAAARRASRDERPPS